MTIPARVRPPGDGAERTQLLGRLGLQRAVVHQKPQFGEEPDADVRVADGQKSCY